MIYSIHQIENVLLELKRNDSYIPILSIMGNLDPSKENDGYTLEEITKAFEDGLSAASLSRDDLVPMPYSFEDMFNLFGEPKTSVEKIVDLYNDRIKRGIIKNQSELASEAEIARSYVSMLMHGQIEKVGDDNLEKFARAFKVPKTYLEDATSTTYLVDMVYKEAKNSLLDKQQFGELTDIQVFEAEYLLEKHPAVLAFCNFMRSKGYIVVYNANELGKDKAEDIKAELEKETNKVIDTIIGGAQKACKRIEKEKKKAFPNWNVIDEAELDINHAKKYFYDFCMIKKAEHHNDKDENDFLKNLNLNLYSKNKEELSFIEQECLKSREKWVKFVVKEKIDKTITKKVFNRIKNGKTRTGIYCEIIMTKGNDTKRFSIDTLETFINGFETMFFSMIKELS